MQLDPDARALVFLLAYELDTGSGTSRMLLSADASGDTAIPPAALSPEHLASRLASLNFAPLDNELIQAALERSVDSARYWQEPDGEDVLAGLPVITAALAPVAEQLVAAPGIRWYWQPRGVKQWAIDWRSSKGLAPLPDNPRETLTEWGRKERAGEERAERERPRDPRANWSGTWWSIRTGWSEPLGKSRPR